MDKKYTQSQIIQKFLTTDWVASYDLIKVSTPWGYLGSGADRTARLLAEQEESGLVKTGVERKQVGKFAYYRKKPTVKPVFGDTKLIHEARWKK